MSGRPSLPSDEPYDAEKQLEGARHPLTMSTQSNYSTTQKTPGRSRPRASAELLAYTLFNFPFGVVLGCSVTLLSLESEKLAPGNSSIMLGLFCVLAGVAQLVCPPLGKLSDRCRSAYGKRRPYMTVFTFPTIAAFFGLWHFSLKANLAGYVLSLLVMMICLSAAQTASLGIIADLVPDAQRGEASGYSGASWLLGALAGNFCLQSVAYIDFHLLYGVMAATLFLAWLTVMLVVQERDTSNDPPPATELSLLEDLFDCFHLDTSGGYDFAFVVLGRAFYYASVASQAFIFFYIRDFLTSDRHAITYNLAGVAIVAYCIACVGSSSVGALSDRPGYGRKRMVYLSCLVMCVACGMLLLFPYVVNGHFGLPEGKKREEAEEFLLSTTPLAGQFEVGSPAGQQVDLEESAALEFDALPPQERTALAHLLQTYRRVRHQFLNFLQDTASPFSTRKEVRGWAYIFVTAMVYAVGNGSFAAVDYALALDTIPDKGATVQNLGFWNISHFVGFAVGPAVYGVLLRLSGDVPEFTVSTEPLASTSTRPVNFSYFGYALVYCTAMLFQFVCAALVFKVKGST
eukprot:g5413.t1